jgi:hypothetical protein
MSVSSVFEIVLAIYLLYIRLGPSSLTSVGVILTIIPMQGLMAKVVNKAKDRKLEAMDNRVRILTEVLSAIKTIKMYSWVSLRLAFMSHRRVGFCFFSLFTGLWIQKISSKKKTLILPTISNKSKLIFLSLILFVTTFLVATGKRVSEESCPLPRNRDQVPTPYGCRICVHVHYVQFPPSRHVAAHFCDLFALWRAWRHSGDYLGRDGFCHCNSVCETCPTSGEDLGDDEFVDCVERCV